MICDNCGAGPLRGAMVVDIDSATMPQELWCLKCIRNIDQIRLQRPDVLGKHITTDDEAKDMGWDEP